MDKNNVAIANTLYSVMKAGGPHRRKPKRRNFNIPV